AVWGMLCAPALAEQTLSVHPPEFHLRGKAASQRLVVTGQKDGRMADVTREAVFQSETPNVVQVDEHGIVTPTGDGAGVVRVTWNGGSATASVEVLDAGRYLPASFELDIQPILSARGCNSGACHGKARGQNGFQLSLLAFDPDFDYEALTVNARG